VKPDEMKRYLNPISAIEPSIAAPLADSFQSEMQWVYLIAPPDSFSYEQALLLSQTSNDEWIAWIPDYGETTLHRSEFYFLHEWN
jgi:hypothetical protein